MPIGEFGGAPPLVAEVSPALTTPMYWMYEMGHASLNPARAVTDATKILFQNPLNPWSHTEFGKSIAAACELLERKTRRYGKPEWGLDTTEVNGVRTPVEVRSIWEKPCCRLLYFDRKLTRPLRSPQPRVLIVAPMSGHYATLLKGTVEAFLPAHEVYITDWSDARQVPMPEGRFALDDYLDYVIEMLTVLGGNVHFLAVCQPSVPVLAAAQPELEGAQQELAAVRAARARIETESLSPQVVGLLERLDRILPWFETGVDGALLAPDLLGVDGPRTYLVLAQNNQELRATGGFISGVGELHIEGGRIASLQFDDSYAVDNFGVPHEVAPADFQATLGGQLWLFRDTNWDPDFPTSARRALEVYANDRGVQADGVVTLDLTALQGLVDATGPIQVEGIEEIVTGANVLQVIQAAWGEPAGGSGQEWWLHRKDFMGEIASAAMNRLMAGEGLEPVRLARTCLLYTSPSPRDS